MVCVILRLPDDLARDLTDLAAKNYRSRNSEMILGLEEYVRRNQQQHNQKVAPVQGMRYATVKKRREI